MDSYPDDIDQNTLQFVSFTIIKGYLKYGRINLAESFMDFISPKLSTNQDWLLRGKLTFYVCSGQVDKINELKDEYVELNQASGRWNETQSEVAFYSYLSLRYLDTANYFDLMQSINKLVQLNKKPKNSKIFFSFGDGLISLPGRDKAVCLQALTVMSFATTYIKTIGQQNHFRRVRFS